MLSGIKQSVSMQSVIELNAIPSDIIHSVIMQSVIKLIIFMVSVSTMIVVKLSEIIYVDSCFS